ncbi:MAG: DUF1428 domain-containing protein [Pseudomonadota bacterium]
MSDATYLEIFLAAAPEGNRDAFIEHSRVAQTVLKENGALRVVDGWGADVPAGQLTSMPLAVKAEPGETVIGGWIEWPDKATRDKGMAAMMADPRMQAMGHMPFDGKRMIFGGFDIIVES